MPLVQYHDLTHNPVGLWQLNGDLTDSSGNGFDLVVQSGNVKYGPLLPGMRGAILNSVSLKRNTFEAALAITGDLTIECLINHYSYSTALRWLVGHENPGETSADNVLYAIDFMSTTGRIGFFSESGTGVDSYYPISPTEIRPSLGPFHFAVTRTSNVIQFYVNGRTLGDPSSALITPTDGSSGRFTIGSLASQTAPECTLASLKVIASALTANQVKAEYNRTLGTFYGIAE